MLTMLPRIFANFHLVYLCLIFGLQGVNMINGPLLRYFLKTAVITGCFFMYSCENNIQDVKALGIKNINQEVAENIESYMSQEGKVRAKLTSPLMLRTEKDTPVVEFPKTLHVDFYDDSVKIESRLFAKYNWRYAFYQ